MRVMGCGAGRVTLSTAVLLNVISLAVSSWVSSNTDMESPDPFAPGFGEFQGIPNRTLPDDCMEYAIFAVGSVDAKKRLEEVKKEAEELAAKWSKGYIWQREWFSVELVEKEEPKTWYLQGRTEYGDSVEDEWFIVWMLRELSKKFTDLWIRVYDTDGEFLLIEAANALPKWLNPEIADHRVWINSGNLLIIPLSAAAPTTTTPSRTQPISRSLALSEALTLIATTPNHLTRIRLVEEEAFYRTTSYPAAAQTNLHRATITIPRTIAHILHTHPSSIAAAVEAFYLRDPISLKSLTTMKHFPPRDLVNVTTTFTKVLYAQLKGQEFAPPSSAGFPPAIDDTAKYNAIDIGTKLTCGFEMLLSDTAAPQLSSPSRRTTLDTINKLLSSAAPLPTDAEIATWPKKDDSEDWLDVDYAAFEETLQGQPGHKGTQNESGWGDKGAEENLKRMVERFEAFLNDDTAGMEGAEVDEMDEDDDDGDDEEEEEEDREVSFDEGEFERMMREMMGMPAATLDAEGVDEEKEIRKVMGQVEAELREAGALETGIGTKTGGQRIKEVMDEDMDEDEDEDEDRELNIDYTLAANMLESFKGQGGMPGPGGNLLARMGIVLPRDDPRGGGGEAVVEGKGKGKEIEQ